MTTSRSISCEGSLTAGASPLRAARWTSCAPCRRWAKPSWRSRCGASSSLECHNSNLCRFSIIQVMVILSAWAGDNWPSFQATGAKSSCLWLNWSIVLGQSSSTHWCDVFHGFRSLYTCAFVPSDHAINLQWLKLVYDNFFLIQSDWWSHINETSVHVCWSAKQTLLMV